LYEKNFCYSCLQADINFELNMNSLCSFKTAVMCKKLARITTGDIVHDASEHTAAASHMLICHPGSE
jgi:hypothetical protein